MPKIKPHKGLQKRTKVTATGKVKRRKANKGHLMSTKSGTRRRQLGKATIAAKANEKKLKRLLGKG